MKRSCKRQSVTVKNGSPEIEEPPDERAAIIRKKSLSTIADIAGVWVGDGCFAVTVAFSSPVEARFAAGIYGITADDKLALRSLAEFPRFPDRAYSWTDMCGADRVGAQFFQTLRLGASKVRFSKSPQKEVIEWHQRMKKEFFGWFTITAFFVDSESVGWIEGTDVLDRDLEGYSKITGKKGEHLFYVGLDPEITLMAIRQHIAPVGFMMSAADIEVTLSGISTGSAPVSLVTPSRDIHRGPESYRQRAKRLAHTSYRILAHSTYARFDSIGYEEIPGGLPFESPIEYEDLPPFLVGPAAAARVLVARHLLLPRDGGGSIDEILYAGRHAVRDRRHFVAGSEIWQKEGILEDDATDELKRKELVNFFSHQLLVELLDAYFDGRLDAQFVDIVASWDEAVGRKVDLGCRFFGSDREAIQSLNERLELEPRELMSGRWHAARLNGESISHAPMGQSPPEQFNDRNLYLTLEAEGRLLPAELRWAIKNCDASLLLRAIGEDRLVALLGEQLQRLEDVFTVILETHIQESWKTQACFVGTMIRRRFDFSGETNFFKARALERTCAGLQPAFCRMLASLAPRCILENMAILLTAGDPPYPVAIWDRKWVIESFKKFVRSHGPRMYGQVIKSQSKRSKSDGMSFDENRHSSS